MKLGTGRALDELRFSCIHLARAKQVGRREEVKVAASENRNLSESRLSVNIFTNFLKGLINFQPTVAAGHGIYR